MKSLGCSVLLALVAVLSLSVDPVDASECCPGLLARNFHHRKYLCHVEAERTLVLHTQVKQQTAPPKAEVLQKLPRETEKAPPSTSKAPPVTASEPTPTSPATNPDMEARLQAWRKDNQDSSSAKTATITIVIDGKTYKGTLTLGDDSGGTPGQPPVTNPELTAKLQEAFAKDKVDDKAAKGKARDALGIALDNIAAALDKPITFDDLKKNLTEKANSTEAKALPSTLGAAIDYILTSFTHGDDIVGVNLDKVKKRCKTAAAAVKGLQP